jgi:uncharacterized protein (TIGR03083 family)
MLGGNLPIPGDAGMTLETTPKRINVMDYGSKDELLRVVKNERQGFYDLVDKTGWEDKTASGEWQVRDLVGHLIDVTEAYLERFALAREGKPFPEPVGLRPMAGMLDQGARRFRSLSRQDAIARLKRSSDGLWDILDRLDENQWTGELIPHVYMGPLPTCFYPTFQLIDYSVHSWDIRAGRSDNPAPLSEDAAETLVPIMLIVLQATLDQDVAAGFTCKAGFKLTGKYGGSYRVNVADNALSYDEGSTDDCQVVFTFDPNEFVLTAYQRLRGGKVEGDPELAETFRQIFFKI